MAASLELEKMKAQAEEEAVLQKVSQAMYKRSAHIQQDQLMGIKTNLEWCGSKRVSWGTTEGNPNWIRYLLQ